MNGEENVAYTYDRISFNFEKEGNPAICNNMDKPGEYYAKWKMHLQFRDIAHILSPSTRSLEKASLCTWLESPRFWQKNLVKTQGCYSSVSGSSSQNLVVLGTMVQALEASSLLINSSRKSNEKTRILVPVLPAAGLEEVVSIVPAPRTVQGT